MKFEEMSYEQVIDHVDSLLAVNSEALDEASLANMKIFSQIERVYATHFKKLKVLMRQQDKVEHVRWRRYTGKWTALQYKEEPLTEAVLKSDVDKYMAIDPQVVEIRHLVDEQEKLVKYLENAKGMIRQRGFDIKTALDFQKFMAGAN